MSQRSHCYILEESILLLEEPKTRAFYPFWSGMAGGGGPPPDALCGRSPAPCFVEGNAGHFATRRRGFGGLQWHKLETGIAFEAA